MSKLRPSLPSSARWSAWRFPSRPPTPITGCSRIRPTSAFATSAQRSAARRSIEPLRNVARRAGRDLRRALVRRRHAAVGGGPDGAPSGARRACRAICSCCRRRARGRALSRLRVVRAAEGGLPAVRDHVCRRDRALLGVWRGDDFSHDHIASPSRSRPSGACRQPAGDRHRRAVLCRRRRRRWRFSRARAGVPAAATAAAARDAAQDQRAEFERFMASRAAGAARRAAPKARRS